MCPSPDSPPDQLRGSLRQIGHELVDYLASPAAGPPPYYAYVYPPKHEFAVRQELQRLDVWLRSRNVTPFSISLAEFFWRAIEESGYRDRIEEDERENGADFATLERLATDINQILMSPRRWPIASSLRWRTSASDLWPSSTEQGRCTPVTARRRCSTTCASGCSSLWCCSTQAA